MTDEDREQLEGLDEFLTILRKHRVAHFDGAYNGADLKITLRDDAPPSVAEQLSKIPAQTAEDMEAVLFHSAPPLPDLPKPPPGLQPYSAPAK